MTRGKGAGEETKFSRVDEPDELLRAALLSRRSVSSNDCHLQKTSREKLLHEFTGDFDQYVVSEGAFPAFLKVPLYEVNSVRFRGKLVPAKL